MATLYHYVHCPFCIRVRMALGYLGIKYNSVVLPYDDEETPLSLTGVKMLPIYKFDESLVMNESLDIIKKLDANNKLDNEQSVDQGLDEQLNRLGSHIHSLCMPYWIYTPEFNESSRNYFQKKKEIKRGPFYKLAQNKKAFIEKLQEELKEVEQKLTPYYESEKFTIKDIMLASHLWGMYIFPEFQFSEKIHQYLQDIKKMCNFDYHEDFWRTEVPLSSQ